MKSLEMKKHTIVSVIIVLFYTIACEEKDFDIPSPKAIAVPQGEVISIASVKAGLDRVEQNTITFSKEQFVDAYVISTDKGGNFFKKIVLQDKPKNPTSGIQVLVDERNLYQRYPLGSKIRISLKDLSVGLGNGVSQLGVLVENEIEAIPFTLLDKHLFRTTEIATLKPLEINVNTLSFEKESLYVTFNKMQFPQEFVNQTLAAEVTDRFDGLRPVYNCETQAEIVLSTSTFSSFKNFTIPNTSGKITGVLSRDFADEFFVLKMNSATDLQFVETERCDPHFFDCEQIGIMPTNVLFKEDFETITNENKLEPLGWENINITGDEKRWTDKKITNINNRVLSISAFNTKLRPLEAWLITPEINTEEVTGLYLEFRVRTRFNNGKTLKIWLTDAYSGDPLTTDWKLLEVDIPITSSNYVTIQKNISCLSGKVRVAFQYKGYDPSATSTYEIDDVVFYGRE